MFRLNWLKKKCLKMSRRRVVLGVECLEGRMLLSGQTYFFLPETVNGVLQTSWVRPNPDGYCNWIDQYGHRSTSCPQLDDIAIFNAGSTDCTLDVSLGTENALKVLELNGYQGILTLSAQCTVSGGSAGFFSMNSGNIDIESGNSTTPGLYLYNAGGGSEWSGGSITAGTGMGDVEVDCNNVMFDVGLVIDGAPGTFGSDMTIQAENGGKTFVTLANMSENLGMNGGDKILVKAGGTLNLNQVNGADQGDRQGGIVTVGAAVKTPVIDVEGGILNRGQPGAQAPAGSVLVDRPVYAGYNQIQGFQNESGTLNLYPGYTLHISGIDPGDYSYINSGGLTYVSASVSQTNNLSGDLLCDGQALIGLRGDIGSELFLTCGNSAASPLDEISAGGDNGLVIDKECTLHIQSIADAASDGAVRVTGFVTFYDDSNVIVDCWGATDEVDGLVSTSAISLGTGVELTLNLVDGMLPDAGIGLDVLTSMGGGIGGAGSIDGNFSTIKDNLNDGITFNSDVITNGTYRVLQVWLP